MFGCLGTNGSYITTRRDMQLDPGESKRLALKGASLSFVFEQTWVLSPSKQGRYLHIMNELLLISITIFYRISCCCHFFHLISFLMSIIESHLSNKPK